MSNSFADFRTHITASPMLYSVEARRLLRALDAADARAAAAERKVAGLEAACKGAAEGLAEYAGWMARYDPPSAWTIEHHAAQLRAAFAEATDAGEARHDGGTG